MKEIKEEADRLVKLYGMYDVMITDLMGVELEGYENKHAIQCAIIDVSNTIEVLEKFGIDYNIEDEWFDSVQYDAMKLHEQVKTNLENRLK